MSDAPDSTPLMKQYWELKAQAGDALMLFRMGDFYELFGPDAVEASRLLEITLTTRDRGKPDPLPMAGVPHHSVGSYIQRLLKAGRKVAIAEQMGEAPAPGGRSIVKREIVRLLTPAVQFEHETSEPAFLAAAIMGSKTGAWVLALLDPSTGEARVSEALSEDALLREIDALPIRHLLRLGGAPAKMSVREGLLIEDLPANYLALSQARACLCSNYGVASLDAFFSNTDSVYPKTHALGLLVTYASRAQRKDRLPHLRTPEPLHAARSMALGPRAAEHLDFEELYALINKTRSALGARQLRRWLWEPLSAPEEISARQSGVGALAAADNRREKLSRELAEVYDLERISGRIAASVANPRDTLALGRSVAALERIAGHVLGLEALTTLASSLTSSANQLLPLATRILKTQREEAPLDSRDGGIFAKGADPELDRLITLTEEGQRWLVDLETRERAATGIPSLKVRYNRVFGYFIEITQAHLKNAPAHYQRKQTTVGAERFFTEELKKFEDEIVTAEARRKALERRMFDDLLAAALSEIPAVMKAARALGEIDALASLSALASEPGWVFPQVDASRDLEIEAGRHPLVDRPGTPFVPNDVRLSPETRLTLLITGPNMGGKSTVMRQAALIVTLGQIGAPVPAARARWGAVSSLHTRIGAHDAISRGQSTFMVEMTELAHILHRADDRSLVILDEIGRGTSTYDGISVAWATLEWISSQIRARTLFATHYHELTRLADSLPACANAHLAVDAARGGSLRFLYQLREGPANESFGIHVARLAGIPDAVIRRSWEVLADLERSAPAQAMGAVAESQLSLFAGDAPPPAAPATPEPWLTELRTLDVNTITPVQALTFLVKIQEDARDSI